jgi:hypothetical protein
MKEHVSVLHIPVIDGVRFCELVVILTTHLSLVPVTFGGITLNSMTVSLTPSPILTAFWLNDTNSNGATSDIAIHADTHVRGQW